MEVKLLTDCKYGSSGDVVKIEDAAVAQTLIDAGVAQANQTEETPVEGEAIEKAFVAKNEKALEAKASKIEQSFEAKLKALKETIEKNEAEIAQLKSKAAAPNLGTPATKPDGKFGFKSLGDAGQSFIASQEGNADQVARWSTYRSAIKSMYGKHMTTKAATLNTVNDTGFVPPDFQKEVWEPTFGSPFLYKEATLWNTDSASTYVSYIKDLDHTSSIGGVTITDLDPDANTPIDIVESKLTSGSTQVTLKLFAALCPISEQVKRWSPFNAAQITGKWMQNAIQFKIEDMFNNNTTFGWRTSGNGTLNKVTRKTANRIQWVDICNMMAAAADPFNPTYDGFYWVITGQNSASELGRLAFPDKDGTFPIFLGNANNVNNAQYRTPQMLQNIPVIYSEFASALGSEGDIALICPRNYWSVRHTNTDFNLEESLHFKFNKGGTVLRLIGEAAFSPTSSGKTKLKSGDYISSFVVLDDVVSS